LEKRGRKGSTKGSPGVFEFSERNTGKMVLLGKKGKRGGL